MKTNRVYWDTCIFISWLKKNKSAENMSGIDEMISSIESGKTTLITSVITITEVQDVLHTPELKPIFEQLFARSGVDYVAVDMPICQLGLELSYHYHLSPIDAIHVATAIVYKASQFYTFDGERKRKKNSQTILYNATTLEAKYGVKVMAPYIETPNMLDLYGGESQAKLITGKLGQPSPAVNDGPPPKGGNR